MRLLGALGDADYALVIIDMDVAEHLHGGLAEEEGCVEGACD